MQVHKGVDLGRKKLGIVNIADTVQEVIAELFNRSGSERVGAMGLLFIRPRSGAGELLILTCGRFWNVTNPKSGTKTFRFSLVIQRAPCAISFLVSSIYGARLDNNFLLSMFGFLHNLYVNIFLPLRLSSMHSL